MPESKFVFHHDLPNVDPDAPIHQIPTEEETSRG
jgi:hypothetical protein